MEAFLARLSLALPEPARRLATPARLALLAQFLRFGVVGTVGFLMDTATVYALRHPLGLYGAGAVSYLTAASANWLLNRSWTFRQRRERHPGGAWHREWGLFLLANLAGFVLNRGMYFTLIATSPLCRAVPVIPVGAGALTGMLLNFILSRALVFR